ncbi:S46 family peptidase [Acetobacteroides hydrogenigenes]|uniref:Dipeptidyl-peptidase n=1 Tax=Acetobacteroides hydrogenigenes TaxID=979970 RepID=A0A4R2E395_9BACT|nr:S46 family peptidase [Acetobacteroides hydrogenigenes]TCN61687.1 peptidase S46-like protein [Acetobacteroides hydrogenigenes]
MRKISILLVGLLLLGSTTLRADEGMWLLPLIEKLNAKDMKKAGLKLSPEDIYSINKSSLKDAIVIFGRGCTGEIVSDQGLLLTNHHCGYGTIQQHSTVEHDYLKNGFWAMNKEQEIPSPGLTVTFLERIEDVTARFNDVLTPSMTEQERYKAIADLSKKLADEASNGKFIRGQVTPMYGGNQFYLFVYKVYTDVRLVGTPPDAIGKFGADTDNWMWPRHTGDFSVFRVYADKDGNPADYNANNVPLKPKKFLKVSLKGIKAGDYTMIMGNPGRTNRYMTSWEIDEVLNISNPNRIKIRGIRQDIWMKDMQANDTIRIQYASKYAGSSNYWKNSIGMSRGLKRLKVQDKKAEQEARFTSWVNQSPERVATYGNALALIKEAVESRKEVNSAIQYLGESIRGIEVVGAASRYASALIKSIESKEDLTKIKESTNDFYKDYNEALDKKVAVAMFALYKKDVPAKYLPSLYNDIQSQYNNNIEAYVNDLYAKSIFSNKKAFNAFLSNPTVEAVKNDPIYKAAQSISVIIREISEKLSPLNEKFAKGQRLYIAGLLEMEKDKPHYPDANFTMRLTYGNVLDYIPADAVHYNFYTTLDGVMEKEDPTNWEFVVPSKLKELYNAKDYGRYAMKNGKMPVAFLSTNDITGGNSGSPIMNANGELIGLAFDGNWEAMSGDIAFEPQLQRTINVDIRYVLFIMDKYAGAKHLVDEMTIVE